MELKSIMQQKLAMKIKTKQNPVHTVIVKHNKLVGLQIKYSHSVRRNLDYI